MSLSPDRYYYVYNQSTGDGQRLDIINDNEDREPHMAKAGNYSGQYWRFTEVGGGWYRVNTMWQGTLESLDIRNDGVNTHVWLAATGAYSGQYWKLDDQGGGVYRMSTMWQGDKMDMGLDGTRPQLQQESKDKDQLWRLEETGTDVVPWVADTTKAEGGSGGDAFDLWKGNEYLGQVTKLHIWHGDVFDGLKLEWGGRAPGHVGGDKGASVTIDLKPGELIVEMSGTWGNYFGAQHLLSVSVSTRMANEDKVFRTMGPYGTGANATGVQKWSIKADGKTFIGALHGTATVHTDGTDYLTSLGATLVNQARSAYD